MHALMRMCIVETVRGTFIISLLNQLTKNVFLVLRQTGTETSNKIMLNFNVYFQNKGRRARALFLLKL